MSRIAMKAASRAALTCAIVLLMVPFASAQLPETFDNLQVLPKDIEQRELIDTMRGFAGGLGVRCQHCHLGEEGKLLSTFDFVSDDKEAKRIAREMMRMTTQINDLYIPRTGRPEATLATVACITCHRGNQRPESLEANLSRELADSGLDAAVDAYRQLRERYYGRQAFDFGENSLIRLAEQQAQAGHHDAAQAFLELNQEFYPESTRTLATLGALFAEQGKFDAAITAYEKAVGLQPGSKFLEQRLEAIREQAEAAATKPAKAPSS